MKKYRCSKCKTECKIAYLINGIGEYCPNPKCSNTDWGLEEITLKNSGEERKGMSSISSRLSAIKQEEKN